MAQEAISLIVSHLIPRPSFRGKLGKYYSNFSEEKTKF